MPLAYFVDEIKSPFVINDIKKVAAKVDVIYLFSVDILEGKEALPNNVIVFEEFVYWKSFKPLKIVLVNLFSIIGIYLNECFALKKLLPFKQSIALLASNIYKAECIMDKLNSESKVQRTHQSISTFYSFWFYDCIYLAWMRKKGLIEKAITRAHGGDLFEERGSLSGKILFRNFQGKYLDRILSVSKTGTDYLQHKYPKFNNKIETVYLGSPNHENLNPINNEERFVMVSCALVRNIKRIHKIAEMLQLIDFPLTWYHIGSQNLQAKNDPTIPIYIDNVEKLKLKTNIEFVPKGNMSNEEVMKFFSEVPINLFISLSEAEGVPVSIMEAISFGVPILSTDVGGCKEIVTDETGILVPLETEMEEIARTIKEFKSSQRNTAEYRSKVRLFWENKFNSNNISINI